MARECGARGRLEAGWAGQTGRPWLCFRVSGPGTPGEAFVLREGPCQALYLPPALWADSRPPRASRPAHPAERGALSADSAGPGPGRAPVAGEPAGDAAALPGEVCAPAAVATGLLPLCVRTEQGSRWALVARACTAQRPFLLSVSRAPRAQEMLRHVPPACECAARAGRCPRRLSLADSCGRWRRLPRPALVHCLLLQSAPRAWRGAGPVGSRTEKQVVPKAGATSPWGLGASCSGTSSGQFHFQFPLLFFCFVWLTLSLDPGFPSAIR